MPDDFIPVEAGITIDGVATAVNLIAAKRTYWLYTPVMKPSGLKAFHDEQR